MQPNSAGGERGKLARFIRKNKALSAVVAVVGGYFAYRELHKNSEEESGEVIEGSVTGSGEGPLLPNEISNEGVDEEIGNVREEISEEVKNREEDERIIEEENRERSEPGESEAEIPAAEEKEPGSGNGPVAAPAEVIPASQGVSISGKEFAGATGKTIVGHGESAGGKKWIEYLINFPGGNQHWRYYTGSGNWEKVSDSKAGPTGSQPNPAKGSGSANGISENTPVAAPPKNSKAHPNAINTGNPCINGGVGEHTAPTGYHLFCENGWIWRDKNVAAGSSGGSSGGGSSPAPAPKAPAPVAAPASPVCPAGTVSNIQSSRAEVNRLTSEINQLQANISAHPKAAQVGEWRTNINNKQATREQFQGAVDRGHQVAGCGNV